jgi:hypothetical protein
MAATAALVTAVSTTTLRSTVIETKGSAASSALPPSACPPGTLPDNGVCIPVPLPLSRAASPAADRIPRLPERPADYAGYRFPFSATGAVTDAVGDAGAPPGGVLVRTSADSVVTPAILDGQIGTARAVFAGPMTGLPGTTVITLHTVDTGDHRYDYLAFVGRLRDAAAPAPSPREELSPSRPLGHTRDDAAYFEVRRVRPDVDVFALAPDRLRDDAASIAIDPRNVLTLK